MKPLLPPDVFKAELRKLYDALRYNAACDQPHDKMYAVICKGWDLGGVGTCERLEEMATRELGFSRAKITWLPEYVAKLRAFGLGFGKGGNKKSPPQEEITEIDESEIPD